MIDLDVVVMVDEDVDVEEMEVVEIIGDLVNGVVFAVTVNEEVAVVILVGVSDIVATVVVVAVVLVVVNF